MHMAYCTRVTTTCSAELVVGDVIELQQADGSMKRAVVVHREGREIVLQSRTHLLRFLPYQTFRRLRGLPLRQLYSQIQDTPS